MVYTYGMETEYRLIRDRDSEAFAEMMRKHSSENPFSLYLPQEVSGRLIAASHYLKSVKNSSVIMIALSDNRMVAACHVSVVYGVRLCHRAGISLIALRDAGRIPSRLLSLAIDEARERGVSKLDAEVCSEDQESISVFRENGFADEGTRSRFLDIDGSYKDSVLLGLEI